MADIEKLQAMLDEALANETQESFHRWLESVRPHLLENDRWVLFSKIANIQRYLVYGPLTSCDKYHIEKCDYGQYIQWEDLNKIINDMTPEQRLEQLLTQLSEIQRYDSHYANSDYAFEDSQNGRYVLWQDIEAIIKQNFPDDEFH